MSYGSVKLPSRVENQNSEEEHVMINHTQRYSIGVFAFCTVALISFALLVNNGTITTLRGFTSKSFRDIMTSESIYAPLQFQDTTHYTLLSKFLTKYGLDGADELSLSDYDSSTSHGWLSVELFEKATCTGTSYGVGGVVTGQCMNVYGHEDVMYERSLMFECASGKFW